MERLRLLRYHLSMTFPIRMIAIAALLTGWFAPAARAATPACSDHSISASAIRNPTDVEAFVRCAAEYLAEHGTAEAYRAFHEDERWWHGQIYVFGAGVAMSGYDSLTYLLPPSPNLEGRFWGASIDNFGTDYHAELYRMLSIVNEGWTYYSFPNPVTGLTEPKAAYVIEVDWDGERVALGAGIYQGDIPGACSSSDVSAESLVSAPSAARLQEFVRCAAHLVASEGYSAKEELETSPRWRHGGSHVFVMDMMGNQLISGNPFRVNGVPPHEFAVDGPGMDQFGGRDVPAVGDAFGEAFVYYRGHDFARGGTMPRAGFVKRVRSHGASLLVGASYDLSAEPAMPADSCSDNRVSAKAIRTPRDMEAFVRCAAEYVNEHSAEETRRAFHEDERWKYGPYYVFIDIIAEPDEPFLSHISVFPPNPSWEGTSQVLVDNFGTDYFAELHRIMTLVDEGWLHYAFTNFQAGKSEPKSSYVIEIEWEGQRAVVGAGIYQRDLPGNCDHREVNASVLEASPSDDGLQAFVRCAAFELEESGLFAAPILAGDTRWRDGSTYLFGVDAHGSELFSGHSAAGMSELSPVAMDVPGGRDIVDLADFFGETFAYYHAMNPVTGMIEPKVAFVKRVLTQGQTVLVAAGHYPE